MIELRRDSDGGLIGFLDWRRPITGPLCLPVMADADHYAAVTLSPWLWVSAEGRHYQALSVRSEDEQRVKQLPRFIEKLNNDQGAR